MYSCVLYGQTTDKGNEPDGRKIDYTDKGDFNTFPFVSVVYFSAVRLITFVGSLIIQHTAVHVFHSLLINSCFDRILPL